MKIYPFQKEIILREDLAYCYAVALDKNDTDTLIEIITLAINDSKLSQLLDEIDLAFAYP
jgi:hypothetical protein